MTQLSLSNLYVVLTPLLLQFYYYLSPNYFYWIPHRACKLTQNSLLFCYSHQSYDVMLTTHTHSLFSFSFCILFHWRSCSKRSGFKFADPEREYFSFFFLTNVETTCRDCLIPLESKTQMMAMFGSDCTSLCAHTMKISCI